MKFWIGFVFGTFVGTLFGVIAQNLMQMIHETEGRFFSDETPEDQKEQAEEDKYHEQFKPGGNYHE